MRFSCLNCTRKHLSAAQIFYIESLTSQNPVPYFVNCFQAIILHMETLMGYPEHKWLVVGNLNVAEYKLYASGDEKQMEASHKVRELRTKYIEDNVFDRKFLLEILDYSFVQNSISEQELQGLVSGNVMEAINEVLEFSQPMADEIADSLKEYECEKKYPFPFMELIHAVSLLADDKESLPIDYLEESND